MAEDMIIKYRWDVRVDNRILGSCEGWFLFGFIPLYIRDIDSFRIRPKN